MNINWVGPINGLGYGVASTNFVNSLTKLGNQVALFPINTNMEAHEDLHEMLRQCVKNAEMPDFQSPSVRMWHQNNMSQFVGSRRVGFPIFELNSFNEQEFHHLRNLDTIFVCSEWAKQIIEKEVIDKGTHAYQDCRDVHVVPLGVDLSIFYPKRGLIHPEKTIFFNAGKWEIRKGHDVLLECFNKAFTEKDNVELWLLTNNPFNTPEEDLRWFDLCKKHCLNGKIRLLPRLATQQDVCYTMNQADCGVFLARAEGWNLEALEMLACGKDLIITNYSGHTEFCTKENSKLINGNRLESAVDGKWFFGQGEWLKFDDDCKEQTIEAMRAFHKLKQEDGPTVNQEGLKTADKFTWEKAAQKMVKILEEGI